MDISVKLNASVVSYKGVVNINNQNGFYMNGKYMRNPQKDNVSISMDNTSDQYLFAVYNDLDYLAKSNFSGLSFTNEFEKYHNMIKSSRLNIQGKVAKLEEMLDEYDSLLRSSTLGENIESRNMSFSGLIIHDGTAAVLNTQADGAYLVREGSMRRLNSVRTSSERKLHLDTDFTHEGIPEIEKSDTYRFNSGLDIRKTEIIKLMEGDIFVLCSRELAEALGEDAIQEQIFRNDDPLMIANALVNEAVSKRADNDITALVIRVIEIMEEYEDGEEDEDDNEYRHNKLIRSSDKRHEFLRTFIAAALTCLILAGVIYTILVILNTTGEIDDSKMNTLASSNSSLVSGNSNSPSPSKHTTTVSSTATESTQTVQAGSNEEKNDDKHKNGTDNNDQNTDTDDEETTGTNAPSSTVSGTSTEARVYIVKEGDTLSRISYKYYKSVDPKKINMIKEANNLTSDTLQIGQRLIIP